MDTDVGTFTSPALPGNQTVTVDVSGYEPRLILLWTTQQTASGSAADALFGFGAAASSTSRATIAINLEDGGVSFDEDRYHDVANAIITTTKAGVVFEAADLASTAADSFTLNWTTVDSSAVQYHYLAIAGDDIEAKVVQHQAPTTPSTVTVAHGLSAAPTVLLSFSAASLAAPPGKDSAGETAFGVGASDLVNDRWSGSYLSNGSASADRSQSAQFISHTVPGVVVEEATITSVDATNITLNWTKASAAEYHYIVAICGPLAQVGSFNSPAAPGTTTITGTFASKAALIFGFMNPTSASVEDDARFVFGASDGTNHRAAGFVSQQTPSSSADRFSGQSALLAYDHTPTLVEDATVQFDGTDVNVAFSTAETALNEYQYLLIGTDVDATPAPPMPGPSGKIYFGSSTAGTRVEVIAWISVPPT